MTPADVGVSQLGEVVRLRAELEQALVAVEDMDQRLMEFADANSELQARLTDETQRRIAAELRVDQILEKARARELESAEDPAMREELSVTLEELQVMQEELQAAHEALARAQQM